MNSKCFYFHFTQLHSVSLINIFSSVSESKSPKQTSKKRKTSQIDMSISGIVEEPFLQPTVEEFNNARKRPGKPRSLPDLNTKKRTSTRLSRLPKLPEEDVENSEDDNRIAGRRR